VDRQREELHGHHLRGPSSDRSAGAPTPQPSHRECPPSNSEPDDRVPCHIYLQGGETGGEDGRNERFTDCRRVTVAMSSPPRWFAFLPGFSALQAAAPSRRSGHLDLSYFLSTYLVPGSVPGAAATKAVATKAALLRARCAGPPSPQAAAGRPGARAGAGSARAVQRAVARCAYCRRGPAAN
jgi:hypothetical protein